MASIPPIKPDAPPEQVPPQPDVPNEPAPPETEPVPPSIDEPGRGPDEAPPQEM